jgi:integrase
MSTPVRCAFALDHGHVSAFAARPAKKQHAAALKASGAAPFVLYTFRHTCITRWAKHIDPFTLHALAGHTDMNTTKRYVHPSDADILAAMEKVRVGSACASVPSTPKDVAVVQ